MVLTIVHGQRFLLYFLTTVDNIPCMYFDWTRGEVEPLWIYEHVEEAKWNVEQVSNYIR
jgi:hypothetical protein